MGIACGFTYYIHWGTFAFSNLLYVVDMLFVDEQTHALLTFVGNDFLARQGLVANGQLSHVYLTATFLNEFRQTVQVACTSVVVD